MPDFIQIVSALKESMQATLSRSDILKSLAWLIGLLLLATVGAAGVKAPDLLLALLGGLLTLAVLLYLGSYAYCLFNDRDALRSERNYSPLCGVVTRI
jgi:hypothetical protein